MVVSGLLGKRLEEWQLELSKASSSGGGIQSTDHSELVKELEYCTKELHLMHDQLKLMIGSDGGSPSSKEIQDWLQRMDDELSKNDSDTFIQAAPKVQIVLKELFEQIELAICDL